MLGGSYRAVLCDLCRKARQKKMMDYRLDRWAFETRATKLVCEKVAQAYGGPTIIQKGGKDYISNGKFTLVSEGEGGLKRSGGQGDTLTGSLGTLLAYRKAYHDRIWDHDNSLEPAETLALAAFGGSAITRECSRLAYKDFGRSLQAGDLTNHVHTAFLNTIGEPTSNL